MPVWRWLENVMCERSVITVHQWRKVDERCFYLFSFIIQQNNVMLLLIRNAFLVLTRHRDASFSVFWGTVVWIILRDSVWCAFLRGSVCVTLECVLLRDTVGIVCVLLRVSVCSVRSSEGWCSAGRSCCLWWAVFRASDANPRVSGTASWFWRWTPPSTRTPPASTSPPAWCCATARRISARPPGSWCRQWPVKRAGRSAGSRRATTWSFTTNTDPKGCKYIWHTTQRLHITPSAFYSSTWHELMWCLLYCICYISVFNDRNRDNNNLLHVYCRNNSCSNF